MRRRTRSWLSAGAILALALAAGCAAHRELKPAEPTAAPEVAGTSLLKQKCGGCHAVPKPSAMSAAKWTAALERMKRRLDLPAADWDSLAAMAQPSPGPSR